MSTDLSLSASIQSTSWPIYGFVHSTIVLKLRNWGKREVDNKIAEIGLTFTRPLVYGSHIEINLLSLNAHEISNVKAVERSQEIPKDYRFEPDFKLFKLYNMTPEVIKHLGDPVDISLKLESTKNHFLGSMRYWSQPPFLSRFLLLHEDVILQGWALGVEKEQLLELLEQTEPINQRRDVIAQYERDFAARRPDEGIA